MHVQRSLRDKITFHVTRIHGIRNTDVVNAPSFCEVSADIVNALEGRYLVAHNAAVDWDVLHRKLPLLRPPAVLDTLRLARALCPGHDSYSLSNLVSSFELEAHLRGVTGGPHRASYDANAALQLFLFLTSRTQHGILSLRQLLILSELPIKNNGQQELF